jgi:hypothetical protein
VIKKILIFILVFVVFAFDLTAIELVDKTKKVKKNSQGREIAKDGKPIYSVMDTPIINSKITIISAMQVPIIYVEGQKKPKPKKKHFAKAKKIDKTKYFVKKENLKIQKIKTKKIVIDDGINFFKSINKKDNKPIDIEHK